MQHDAVMYSTHHNAKNVLAAAASMTEKELPVFWLAVKILSNLKPLKILSQIQLFLLLSALFYFKGKFIGFLFHSAFLGGGKQNKTLNIN